MFVMLFASCSETAKKAPAAKPSPLQSHSPTPTPIASAVAVSPNGAAAERDVQAEFRGYAYSYRKDGGKTVASFLKKPLPRDGDLVVGAVRDIIARSYGDTVDTHPRLVGSGAEQTIRVDTNAHRYIIVPIKSEAGEIHSLMITQLAD